MYHFIGIKGSGMSALAQIMHRLGYSVQGSDYETHFFTQDGLEKLGISILPFDVNNIQKNMYIVKGAAFSDDHVEVVRAKELNLPIYTYSEMVGKLTQTMKTICVAGCHGKTTTTSMFAHVLNNMVGCNYLIGDGTGYADPNNQLFVLESCEYRRHFLQYHPYYAVITNIDLDHVDYFKDIDDVIDAYYEFANHAEKMIIACGDDPYTHTLKAQKPIFFYGTNDDNDIKALHVQYTSSGISFEVEIMGNYYGSYDLPIYGKHNLENVLAVIAVCYFEKLESKEVAKMLQTYPGAKRRFSQTKVRDCIIIDDYAHHPNEIEATLQAIKQKYPNKKIIVIFQPHTYSRVKQFKNQLIEVFKKVEEVYLLEIHGSREKQEDFKDITSDILIKELDNAHPITLDQANLLSLNTNTVFAFMSPNDISQLEDDLKEQLERR